MVHAKVFGFIVVGIAASAGAGEVLYVDPEAGNSNFSAEVAVSCLGINVQHLASAGARGDSNHDKAKHFSVNHLHSHILAIGTTGSGTACSIEAVPARGPAAMLGCAVARERV